MNDKAVLRSHIVPGLVALALLTLPLSSPGQESAPKERKPSKETLEKYDTDRDGTLSESERERWQADVDAKRKDTRRKNLEKYDSDGDGKLSDSEKERQRADAAAEKEARRAEKKAKKNQN